ncbi:MAG: ABC transporter ATP-binding protein [Pseudomonadota bacterium]
MQALSIRQLRKTYHGGFTALNGIDLNVEPGDFFALLGPNGAGKSTTIGIITTLVKKTAGQIQVFGHDLDENPGKVKSMIGVVPQEFNFHMFEDVEEIVVNQGGYYGLSRQIAKQRAEKYLKALGLWDKRNSRARDLSGGMKRRLMIARALVHEPRLLILDEPTAGVDIEMRRGMWQFLRDINDQGTTIILTTHYLEEAEMLCRNIAIIDHGQIVEDSSMKDLLAKLNQETFVLDIQPDIPGQLELPGFVCRRLDETKLEVDVDKRQNLNTLFTALSEEGLQAVSMRNKANRLEELFMNMLSEREAVPA